MPSRYVEIARATKEPDKVELCGKCLKELRRNLPSGQVEGGKVVKGGQCEHCGGTA